MMLCIWIKICCETGDLELLKILYTFPNIDVHTNNDYAFRLSCSNGHLYVAQWLCSIEPSYGIEITDGKITNYYIKDVYITQLENLQLRNNIQWYDDVLRNLNIKNSNQSVEEECIICYNSAQINEGDIIMLQCGHYYCLYCLLQHYKITKSIGTCLYCRKSYKFIDCTNYKLNTKTSVWY